MVECQLPKLKVASSILVARSKKTLKIFFLRQATEIRFDFILDRSLENESRK
jgi:hypothetical protein